MHCAYTNTPKYPKYEEHKNTQAKPGKDQLLLYIFIFFTAYL